MARYEVRLARATTSPLVFLRLGSCSRRMFLPDRSNSQSSRSRHREIIVYWFMVPEGNHRETNLTVSRKHFSFITEKPLQQSRDERLYRRKASLDECVFFRWIDSSHPSRYPQCWSTARVRCLSGIFQSFVFPPMTFVLSFFVFQWNKCLVLRRRRARWSIIGELHRFVVTRSCRRFSMVDIEDRMTAECKVLHAFVSFGPLQRSENHKANTGDRQYRKNEDNHKRIGK